MSVIANVAINVDSRNAVSKLRQVESQAQVTQRAFEALNGVVAAFGAGFAITKVIQDVKELDTNLRRLGTVGGDVKALDKGLGDLSKRLDGIVSKAELAAASYQGLSAGFTDTAGNLKLVEAATKAAIGGMADTTQVVEVLTKTLNAYGLSGSDAVKVTDSISKAIEYGQVEWSDYTSQLGRVASIAAIAGISLDEVNAFIAAATKNGATAEIAFTGLGAAIQTILQPTKESQEAAKALGIQWNLAGLQAKGFDGLLADLAKKQDTNKEAAARLLGSQEAMRGVFSANAKAGKDYQMILAGLQGAAGKTQSDFDQMKVSLENQLKALDTAFKNLSEALGRAFGPTVVGAVKNVADAINIVADVINAIPQPVKTATGELIKLIAQMLLLQKAVQAIIGLRAAFIATMTGMAATTAATGTAAKTSAGAFALYTSNVRVLQAQAAATTPVLAGLLATLKNFAALGVITVGINLVVTGLQQAIAANAEINKLRGERQAGGVAKSFGGSATADQKAQAQKTLAAIKAERERLAQPGGAVARTALGALAPLAGQPTPAAVAERQLLLRAREQKAQAILGLPTRAGTTGGLDMPTTPSAPYDPDAGKEKQKKEKKPPESQLKELTAQTSLAEKLLTLNKQIAVEKLAGNKTTVAALEIEKILEQRASAIAEAYRERDKRIKDGLAATTANAEAEEKVKQATLAADEQLVEASQQRQQVLFDNLKAYDEELKSLQNQIAVEGQLTEEGRKAALLEQKIVELKEKGVITTQAQEIAYRNANKQLDETQRKVALLKSQQEMLDDLYAGIAGQIANGIGGAIDAVSGGVENLGETLQGLAADILKTIGKMLIMYALAQAFGALGGSDGKGVFSFLAKGFGFKAAKDGGYWPGGFQAFANGGLVTRPTMGLVGEGGEAEYIIPASKMRGAMERYGAGARGAGVIPNGRDSGGASGAAGTTVIDVRYNVERINSVDYVTADEFQAGIRQAAAQGAAQGEQRTLRKLQMSPSVRRRVGV